MYNPIQQTKLKVPTKTPSLFEQTMNFWQFCKQTMRLFAILFANIREKFIDLDKIPAHRTY